MARWDTVAVVGVGLIGGSIGLDLRRRRLAARVVGVGRRASSLRRARQRGAVDATTTRLERGVADAELIVVCTPVERIVEHVLAAAAAAPAGALITDAGSVKQAIVGPLDARRDGRLHREVAFVGSHPLAGGEKGGPRHAVEDLFQDRVVIVTPTERSRAKDVAAVERFWRALGARVRRMGAAEHDAALAAVSHAPHVAAAAVAAATPPEWLPLAATGWRDATRIAAGDPDLWRQILAANRPRVIASLEQILGVLQRFREALAAGDDGRVQQLLEAGKRHRDAVGD